MTGHRDKPTVLANYRRAVELHAKTLRYLQELGDANPEVLLASRRILRHLQTMPDDQVLDVMWTERRQNRKAQPDLFSQPKLKLSDDTIRNLSLDEVRDKLVADAAPRYVLERIAMLRFGVPKSAVSSRLNRLALLEKLSSLIANEATHESIKRVASAKR